MIRGMGLDMIEIERIRRSLKKGSRFAERILTPAEQSYCLQGKASAERTAGRFAAKEAIAKAFGKSLGWLEVEILPDENGKPLVWLSDRALEAAEGGKILLSITHTRELASASAIWVVGEGQ